MKVEIAFNPDEVRKITFQEEFPKTMECCKCKGESRLTFVAHEYDKKSSKEGGKYICQLYDNDPEGKGFWLHDACCVAIYFCKKCLEPTALYNQA